MKKIIFTLSLIMTFATANAADRIECKNSNNNKTIILSPEGGTNNGPIVIMPNGDLRDAVVTVPTLNDDSVVYTVEAEAPEVGPLMIDVLQVNSGCLDSVGGCSAAGSLLTTFSAVCRRHTGDIKTYGLHLFFSEQEAIDVLTVATHNDGSIVGHMFVPNDFEGAIENIVIVGGNIEFDLLVPKNQFRPEDLMFHYKGQYFDESQTQITGYVTLKGEKDFVASFVAFLR